MSSMYFKNRNDAGQQLAEVLFHPYGRSDSVVLALGEGGLLVAKPIALRLQIPIFMTASPAIELPGLFHERVGTMNHAGDFVYSSSLTQGEVEEYVGEYHSHIEAEKMNAMHEINRMLGSGGYAERASLKDKNILIVSDGIEKSDSLDAVMAFLKPVRYKRLVGVTPIASINAIDAMHILTDEIRVLSPKENFVSIDHYYEENYLPTVEQAQKLINELSKNPYSYVH